ncbi:histidine kinase [Psychromonas sp. MME2]|uniref:histidine kinase n=1 Tax=unclassified Psychromonas TaxID=2614957 RepID=UPI00339CECF6
MAEKTAALESANQTIEFLFTTSQQLSVVDLSSPILTEALNSLGKYAQLQKLCLELNNGHFIPSDLGCATGAKNHFRIPIILNSKTYGYLNYATANNTKVQQALIDSFTGLVARALYQQEHHAQEQKLFLMEERSIIARELHDSIAQSLSFLKIQCDLLQRQIYNEQEQVAQQTIDDIKIALDEAYKHLRSLLATFRLNAPQSDFNEALQTVINTLQTNTKATISVHHFSAPFRLDARQHIHLLQIVREAIINAIKHANCTDIVISCIITSDNNVWISINDNGEGMATAYKTDDSSQNYDHFGLSIMQHRADELGAKLTFPKHSKGTEVKIIFPLTACYTHKEV